MSDNEKLIKPIIGVGGVGWICVILFRCTGIAKDAKVKCQTVGRFYGARRIGGTEDETLLSKQLLLFLRRMGIEKQNYLPQEKK